MKIETLTNAVLKETLHKTQLDNGLDILVWPKRGFNKKLAVCSTWFGSVNNLFTDPANGQTLRIPDGIAHFLEHKLFETADGDVFDEFARLGASPNASTSFTTTQYFFTCTDRFTESLTTLLDFVQTPYFTPPAVEKERGIIEQEISMYDDSPDWQLFFRLLGALFENHPVRIDIAGTAETIKAIDVPILKKVYDTFYHPSNMVVFVAGDLDPKQVMEQVAENFERRNYTDRPPVERLFPEEGEAAHVGSVVNRMTVSRPKVLVGFKDLVTANGDPHALLKRELTTSLILDMLMGKSSALYSKLYEKGVIDESFSSSFTAEADHGYTMIGGETDEPDRLVEAVTDCLARAAADGFDAATLERKKRKQMGRFLRNFNSPDTGGNVFLHYFHRKQDVFRLLDELNSIQVDDLSARLSIHFDTGRMATSTLLPVEGEAHAE